jgi:hypothetical protein
MNDMNETLAYLLALVFVLVCAYIFDKIICKIFKIKG